MPGDTEGLWYSFNMGPVHFISISTEVYYFLEYGLKLVTKQYAWLEQELKVWHCNLSSRWLLQYAHSCKHMYTYTTTHVYFMHIR
jgi:hypothetical protein